MNMRLFLFGASVFYVLGLKLISKIEIQPVYHFKPVSTSAPASTSGKNDTSHIQVKTEELKKDSVSQAATQSNPLLAPANKTTEK
jgi:hypothetical protein